MRHARPSPFGAAVFGLLLLWQVWRLLFTPHGVASSWTTRAGLPVVSTGGAGIAQDVLMGADGFDGLWVRVVRDRGAVPRDVRLLVTLSHVRDGNAVPLERRIVALGRVREGAWHVPFREVRASRGMTLRVGLQHVSSADGNPLALAARPDRAFRAGRFEVDGIEQWGALVFETTSSRATLPYWKDEILAPWPAWVRSWPTVVGVWLLGNVLLAVACFGVTSVRPARVRRHDAIPPGDAARPAPEVPGAYAGSAARGALLAGSLVALGGVVLAAWRGPDVRVIPLYEHLAEARIEVPSSLHDAIAIQRAGYQGRMLRAIVALPPARIAWNVQVPRGALLLGLAGMRPDVWDKEGDGVNMRVCVVDGAGTTTQVARFTLLPYNIWEHRAFHPFRVSLDPWAGQEVTVVFETDPERWGNAVNDVPVWLDPHIAWPRGPQWGTGGIRPVNQRSSGPPCP